MRRLYLDCSMGAAGDMLMAALLELTEDKAAFLTQMNGLGLPGVTVAAEPAVKCGITGTHVRVTVAGTEEDDHLHDHDHHDHDHEHEHHHDHHGLSEILDLISRLDLPARVKTDAAAVYRDIARAEGHVHGREVDQIHFHEVGSLDAVADVVGVCLLMHTLAPDEITASAVHVGSGQVRCAHGVLPVPAPATAYLLRDVPIYGGAIRGELCTPTGAALLKHFVTRFGPMEPMRPEKIGYGMGRKDFEVANCLRAMLGTAEGESGDICELRCNLDDMTGEEIGFAMERLLDAGALDVFTTAIGMKKSRPGVMLTCLCRRVDIQTMAALLLRHTTTLGVRETVCRRYTLERQEETARTPWGDVRIKRSRGYGADRQKAEFEDLARIAREQDMTLAQVREKIEK